MAYRGKFRPKNTTKYRGNSTAITYRSLWERNAMRWADENSNILEWSSEEDVIPYRCATDNKIHRYFPDLYLHFRNGSRYMIEIKPAAQTKQPNQKRKRTQKFLSESLTFAKNQSKWESAAKWCESRSIIFEIWTENTLKSLGIKCL